MSTAGHSYTIVRVLPKTRTSERIQMERIERTQALSHVLTITAFHAWHFIRINNTERVQTVGHTDSRTECVCYNTPL